MKKNLKKAGVVSLLLGILVFGIAMAADVSVDNFSNRTQSITHILDGSEPLTLENVNTSTSAVGGHRDVCLFVESGDPDTQARIQASQSSQYLLFALDPTVTGIGYVEWDGSEATCATLDDEGLSAVNVIDAGNTGFVVRVTSSDGLPVDLTIRAYEDGSADWQEQTIRVQTSVATGEVVDVFFPFSSFSGGLGVVDFTTLGAVVLELDATIQDGADIIVKYLIATNAADYGDLPDSGGNAFDAATRGAYHISQGLRFGNNVDTEAIAPAGNATGDDTAGTPDDEDGVDRDMSAIWTPGASVDLLIDVNGCATSCRMNGWIDWNQDGSFSGTNEQVFNDQVVSDGDNQVFSLTVDNSGAYALDDDVYARFRLCPTAGTCNSPTAMAVINGEIEDYFWGFGPTAITLESLSARNINNMVAIGVAGVLVLGGAIIILRRRKTITE